MPVSPAVFKPPPHGPSALLKAPPAARRLSRRAFRQQQSQREAGRERGTLQAKLRSSSRQWPLNHTWVHVRIQPHNWVFQRRSDEAKAAYFKKIMQRAAICPPTSQRRQSTWGAIQKDSAISTIQLTTARQMIPTKTPQEADSSPLQFFFSLGNVCTSLKTLS